MLYARLARPIFTRALARPMARTVICDLGRRRVIDRLPSRSAAPVRDRLAAHPGIAVVSQDRAGPYAEAARAGAPGAVQVADRWHLLVNASEALRSVVERYQHQLRDAARHSILPAPPPAIPAPLPSIRSGRRRARFEAVVRLRAEGLPIKEIARRAGVARNAVRRWLRAGEFVPYRRAPGPSLLDPHLPFAEDRWRPCCATAPNSTARSERAASMAATTSFGAGPAAIDGNRARPRVLRPARFRRRAGPRGC